MIYTDRYKIYAHINKVNGKIYIGQTGQENVKDRWDSGHGYKKCIAFNRAIEKYGWQNFKHIVIFDDLSLEVANIIEEQLIAKYKSNNSKYGYNIKSGGRNAKVSDETREKIRQCHLGTHSSEEARKKLSEHWKEYGHPWTGKHHSEETKEKISKANTGKHRSEDVKKYLSEINCGENNYFYGKHHTEITKKKISERAKTRTGEKNSFYGKKHSEEARKKMSEKKKLLVGEKAPRYGAKLSQSTIDKITKVHKKPVLQYDLQMNFIKRFESATDAANEFGCSIYAISKCCTGKNKTSQGYIFKYEEDVKKEVS